MCCPKAPTDSTPTPRLMQNNYGLRKISKQIQNEENQKKNRQSHQHQRFMWFDNSLRPQVADDEFTITKRDYKIGVETLSQIPKPQYTQISLQGSQITNNREFLFPIQVANSTNTKYQVSNTQTKY